MLTGFTDAQNQMLKLELSGSCFYLTVFPTCNVSFSRLKCCAAQVIYFSTFVGELDMGEKCRLQPEYFLQVDLTNCVFTSNMKGIGKKNLGITSTIGYSEISVVFCLPSQEVDVQLKFS